MKLCSFLMPTRSADPDSLERAIGSIIDYIEVDHLEDVEVLLKIDEDDKSRIDYVKDYECVRTVISPRGLGYNDMGRYVTELLAIADSKWCWLFDDDAWVDGDWFTPLSELDPVCAVNSQFYCLGDSIYPNNGSGEGCGIIIPTTLAREIGPCLPVDGTWLGAVKTKGWPFVIMEGVSYHHDGRQR